MIVKAVYEVGIGDTINGQSVVGMCKVKEYQTYNYHLLVMDKDGYICMLTLPQQTRIRVDDCTTVKSLPESTPESPATDLSWHRISDDPPLEDGRYLVCSKQAVYPVIAHVCVCEYPPIWSRLIEGVHKRLDEVEWWAEIPLPPK